MTTNHEIGLVMSRILREWILPFGFLALTIYLLLLGLSQYIIWRS